MGKDGKLGQGVCTFWLEQALKRFHANSQMAALSMRTWHGGGRGILAAWEKGLPTP